IPDMITNVMPVLDKECMDAVTRSEFLGNEKLIERMFGDDSEDIVLPAQLRIASSHKVTFRMESVGIAHGKRTILKDINWEVRNGEKWGLMGPNGSGKSTLLSLVYADNPQSYANCIYLFDRKRGTGESIWDIKERIGYVSPEMHLYYMEDIPALQIVGSGFFDSIGIYRHCSEEQSAISLQWMKTFGVEHLASVSFLKLSSGEQRLVLLARAFVKDPDLLVLDEPLHGLDIKNKRRATRIIEAFCNRTGKSLVYATHYPHEMPPSVDKEFRLCKN
ncbi:MAG: ATP-binding cassette domain-containing protein, partial [Bacteroidales bacterium]